MRKIKWRMIPISAPAEADTEVVTIFGKTWDFHVTNALRITLDENLKLIADSVRYLREQGRRVIYDAEHFFDGYKNNPDYALKTVEAAIEAGAYVVTLCDTNGGCLPFEVSEITRTIIQNCSCNIGIHTHNDSGCGVANALAAVREGAMHVQGTFNGFGERCGNSDLTSIIPSLMLKMGLEVIPEEKLKGLTPFPCTSANWRACHRSATSRMSDTARSLIKQDSRERHSAGFTNLSILIRRASEIPSGCWFRNYPGSPISSTAWKIWGWRSTETLRWHAGYWSESKPWRMKDIILRRRMPPWNC